MKNSTAIILQSIVPTVMIMCGRCMP